MSGPQPPKVPAKVPAISEDTIQKLIEQQGKEAVLRTKELEIRQQELAYQSKHASDILGAQERDREATRTHTRKLGRDRLIFVGGLIVALLIFAGVGLYWNKDEVVKDILKMLVSAALGALGGFGAGRWTKTSGEKAEEEG